MAKKVTKKTKPKPKKAEKKEEFFVAINDNSSNKMAILETRKDVLESMKLFQSIKELRKRKIQEKINLRKQVRQISSLLGKLKSALPHVSMGSEPDTKADDGAPEEDEGTMIVKTKPETELDRIEAELAEIEGKLSGLG